MLLRRRGVILQEIHMSGADVVDGGGKFYLALPMEGLKNGAPAQGSQGVEGVFSLCRSGVQLGTDGGADLCENISQAACLLCGGQGGAHRPAVGVSHQEDQGGPQMFHGVLRAAQSELADEVAGVADDEQLPDAGVQHTTTARGD